MQRKRPQRIKGDNGTWMDPEELAYDLKLERSRRRAKVMCTDGKLRTATVGIPDTYFTVPARVSYHYPKTGRHTTVTGFIMVQDDTFHFYQNKHSSNYPAIPEVKSSC